MTLWTNVDATDADKPKYVIKDANGGLGDNAKVFGVDAAEAQITTVTHAGWVRKVTGTGGRAGRVQYETLVAMGSITGDAEDVAFPNPTIVISALVTPVNLVSPAPLTIAATVTGTASKLTYQWKKSLDGLTGWTNVTGAKTATLSVSPTVAGTLYYKLTVVVQATDTTAALTAESNVVQVVAA